MLPFYSVSHTSCSRIAFGCVFAVFYRPFPLSLLLLPLSTTCGPWLLDFRSVQDWTSGSRPLWIGGLDGPTSRSGSSSHVEGRGTSGWLPAIPVRGRSDNRTWQRRTTVHSPFSPVHQACPMSGTYGLMEFFCLLQFRWHHPRCGRSAATTTSPTTTLTTHVKGA